MTKILITGAAGFIGFNLINKLLNTDVSIVCIDNFQQNHDFKIKVDRVESIGYNFQILKDKKEQVLGNSVFIYQDLKEQTQLDAIFKKHSFDVVIHLAAQTGVRYSVSHPQDYIDNNITTFKNILECCKNNNVRKLVFSSSSSVYGLNNKTPYKEKVNTDCPASFYAVTKKTNELMAYYYSTLYDISYVGLRFFTVYGPWCRTDMASGIFMKSIIAGEEINVFNDGDMARDFTYINDITECIEKVTKKIIQHKGTYRKLLNIGNNNSCSLNDFISAIENALGKKAKIKYQPLQQGDVKNTLADVSGLMKFINFKPATPLNDGVHQMVSWYKEYVKLECK